MPFERVAAMMPQQTKSEKASEST
eukprot:SAG11_NODE_37574_length_256_cov_0.662420_1_plen_23_part_10